VERRKPIRLYLGGEGERVKLTKRGKRVRAVILISLALYVIVQVSANLWYVEGSGYCWGSVEKCYEIEGEGNK
jgi:hypothetical protein